MSETEGRNETIAVKVTKEMKESLQAEAMLRGITLGALVLERLHGPRQEQKEGV